MGFFSDWCVILFGSGVALQELDARNAEKKKSRSPMFNAGGLPRVNVDGSPMVGNVDIHGNPYGFTNQNQWDSVSSFQRYLRGGPNNGGY